jgi:hypothetical protein
LEGLATLRKFPAAKELYAFAAVRFGAMLPPWQLAAAQLCVNIGAIVLENTTVSVTAGELSIITVVVLEQLPNVVTIAIKNINPIPIIIFDMILVLFLILREQSNYFLKVRVKFGWIPCW